jgi:predicted nucleic acid-binding protein
MRLFLDANILFTAAHNPKGKAIFLIELGGQGHWELFSSPYALEEARRNLERKFPNSLDGLGSLVRGICLIEHRAGFGHPAGLAQKDQPIFQAALGCQATHLLTGDLKDFGPFMNQPENTFGIRIQTVAEFLHYQEFH